MRLALTGGRYSVLDVDLYLSGLAGLAWLTSFGLAWLAWYGLAGMASCGTGVGERWIKIQL